MDTSPTHVYIMWHQKRYGYVFIRIYCFKVPKMHIEDISNPAPHLYFYKCCYTMTWLYCVCSLGAGTSNSCAVCLTRRPQRFSRLILAARQCCWWWERCPSRVTSQLLLKVSHPLPFLHVLMVFLIWALVQLWPSWQMSLISKFNVGSRYQEHFGIRFFFAFKLKNWHLL